MVNGRQDRGGTPGTVSDLGRVTEMLTRRVLGGKAVDVDGLAAKYPRLADAIRGIYATLLELRETGGRSRRSDLGGHR